MYNALYARQSIEKKDSISVESQLEYCRYETHGESYREYTDKGFSGKNTNRPGFEQMMRDIRMGRIQRVIVYKLDRISRSILDFANMMEIFQTYGVEFISSTEKFDTSTPIGRAMLNICIVFAQLERETIQKRVADAYHARCRRGFYMGGRIPYGYRLTHTSIDQIRTSMYEEVPAESEQLKLIYTLYADTSYSLGDIVRYLKEHQIQNLRGANWNTARISEMLRNPIYVRADSSVYCFFQSQGTKIHNPISDFTGYHACYLYQGTDSNTKKHYDLSGKELVLAPHPGIIPPQIWLACRKRSLNSRHSAVTCKPKNSWLCGKVKCGNCGYALTIRKSRTKWGRYFVCSHSGNQGTCKGAGCTVYADVLETYILAAMQNKLQEFPFLSNGRPPVIQDTATDPQSASKKIRLIRIDEEIDELLSQIPKASGVLMRYIDQKVSRLDAERQALREAMTTVDASVLLCRKKPIPDFIQLWETLSFADRQTVADLLIQAIRIADGHMEIHWNI